MNASFVVLSFPLLVLSVLIVPLVILALPVLLLVLLVKLIRGPERKSRAEASASAIRENQDFHAGLERMAGRIEALEEILLDRLRPAG